MAIETFRWPVQRGETGTEESTVRTSRFGDGYQQTSGDGLNTSRMTWPVTFSGKIETAKEVRDFLRRNAGKSFLWRDPFGDLGLYQAPTRSFRIVGRGIAIVMATFEQSFHP